MTEAKFKGKKNKEQTSDNRISANSTYNMEAAAKGQPMKSTAAVKGRRGVIGGAASFGRSIADPRSTTGETPRVSSRDSAKAGTRAVSKAKRTATMAATKVEYVTTEVEKSRRHAFPLSIVLTAACATILIMAIITTGVQINDITAQNSELKTKYSQLVKQSDELGLLLETRDDLRIVEAVAKEELGMVKKDQVDRYYLTVHKEDKIEIIETIEEEGVSFADEIKAFANSVVERILGFFGV